MLDVEDDHRADLLAPFAAGHGDDGGLGHLRQREQLALHLQRADLLAARLDDVGGLAALDEVHRALGPRLGAVAGRGDRPADGHVARSEPPAAAVLVGGELLGGGLGAGPVFFEDGWPAELDLAGALPARGIAFFAWFDDLVGVSVNQPGLDGRQGPTDAGINAISKIEAAAQRHADFGHAVSLQQQVPVTEDHPRGLDGCGKRRGAGDAEAHAIRGDATARRVQDLGREGLEGAQQAAVDGGDDGEESDLFPRRRRPVGREEGGGETLPYGVGVEGEEELDGGAGEQRCEDGVDGAMDVVQWEDMEEMVGWRVVPGFHEGARLCRQDGLR